MYSSKEPGRRNAPGFFWQMIHVAYRGDQKAMLAKIARGIVTTKMMSIPMQLYL